MALAKFTKIRVFTALPDTVQNLSYLDHHIIIGMVRFARRLRPYFAAGSRLPAQCQ